MERDHLALPYEYLSEMEELTDEEFGQLVRALMRYSMGGAPIPREGNLRFFAARVMAREDRYQKAYSEMSDKRKAAGKRGAARRWGEETKDTAPVASDSEGRASDNSDIANDSKNSNAILPIASDSKNSQAEAEAEAEAEAYTEADSSFLSDQRKERKEGLSSSRAQEKTLLVALGCGKTPAPPTPVGEVVRSGARASPERADRWDYERQRWVMDGG